MPITLASNQFPHNINTHALSTTRIHKHARVTVALFIFLFAIFVHAIEFKKELLTIVENRFGDDAVVRLLDWQRLANTLSSRPDKDELKQLEAVNTFFNRAEFISDIELWNNEDYWATPVELLAKNAGDCEDYSIAKFFTLIDIGFEESKLQISYVKALELNQAHMVLAYYATPNAEPLILDNINPNILPASARTDLEPVYSFNGLGLWLNRFERESSKRIGKASAIDEWNDMLRRQGILMLKKQP